MTNSCSFTSKFSGKYHGYPVVRRKPFEGSTQKHPFFKLWLEQKQIDSRTQTLTHCKAKRILLLMTSSCVGITTNSLQHKVMKVVIQHKSDTSTTSAPQVG